MELKRLVGSLTDWANSAQAGSAVIYHSGQTAKGPVCREALTLYNADAITLVQKRAAKQGHFLYIAQKVKRKQYDIKRANHGVSAANKDRGKGAADR